MDKRNQLILILMMLSLIFGGCNFLRFDPIEGIDPDNNRKEILSVDLLWADNPALGNVNISALIDSDSIRLIIPAELMNTNEDPLILSFETLSSYMVTIDNKEYISGETAMVFGHNQNHDFTLHGLDGTESTFQLKIEEYINLHIYTYDYTVNSNTDNQGQINSPWTMYFVFSCPIDANSFKLDMIQADPGLNLTNLRPVNAYKFAVDMNADSEGLYRFSLEPNLVFEDSSDPNSPSNSVGRYCNVTWDTTIPTMASSPLTSVVQYADQVKFIIGEAEDNYTTDPNDLRYRICYNSAETMGALIELTASNMDSAENQTDWFSIGVDPNVIIDNLAENSYYNFALAVQDLAGNISYSDNLTLNLLDAVYVSTTGDDITGNGTKSQPFRSIQKALDAAFSNGIAEVRVAEGTYYPGSNRTDAIRLYPDMRLRGGYNRDFSSYDPLLYPTIISGDIDGNGTLDSSNSEHLIFNNTGLSNPPNINTLLEGLTLTLGYCSDTTLGGGAIATYYKMSLRNVMLKNNQSTNQSGAALFALDGVVVYIENSHFKDNRGGAIYMKNGFLNLKDSSFTGNTSSSGGALFIESVDSRNWVGLKSSGNLFENNSAQQMGGAVALTGPAEYSFSRDQFSHNSAGSQGGAIAMKNEETNNFNLELSNSFMQYNAAPTGGAMSIMGSSTDELYIYQNLIIFSNVNSTVPLTSNGSALYLNHVITQCVGNLFYGNSGENNSVWDITAVNETAINRLTNNLFMNIETARDKPFIWLENGLLSYDYNQFYQQQESAYMDVIDQGSNVTLTENNGNIFSNSVDTPDLIPLFIGDPQAPQGPDGIIFNSDDCFIPAAGSPLIDMGYNISNLNEALIRDIRGNDRNRYSAVDIGPYEY